MEDEDYLTGLKKSCKQHNVLLLWGNEATMNLNPLILANIQGSSYFKVHLFKLKTYHEVVDEIYYQVKHLEPWERGSRKTAGQTGMCGGVRGVGAGGIVSTAFCLLYKLYTLRLTRKQVNGLLNHTDSPYIRALGFMYIRYTQPPGDLYDWYEDYFLDEEEIDVKAGGGQTMTIGQMAHQFLTKLDWFSTLFPRIPVPIQKQIEKRLEDYSRFNNINFHHLHQQHNVRQQNNTNSYAAGPSAAASSTNNYESFERERDNREYATEGNGTRSSASGGRRGGGNAGVGDTREYVPPPRERERTGGDRGERDYYGHREFKREDRYEEKSRSGERSDYRGEREKHKKKHKSRDRDRSRSRSREKRGNVIPSETSNSFERTEDMSKNQLVEHIHVVFDKLQETKFSSSEDIGSKKIKHQCDICKKCFPTPYKLKRHMTSHSNVKLFNCKVCPKNYKTEKTLLYHMQKNHKHLMCHAKKTNI